MADFNLEGFENQSIISSDLSAPLALGFLPDNRMLVLEKGGEILIADPNTGTKSPYLDISNIVNSGNERGLLDIAIPPDFDPDPSSGNNQIYLFYTRSADTNRAVIASFDHVEGAGGLASTADVNSEEILWTDTDEYVACCHYGGGLDFGPDGKIWLTSSDKFNTSNNGEGGPDDNWPVNVENTSGKIIRINRDGTIPDGTDGFPANPYVDGIVDGPYPASTDPEFGGSLTPDPSIWAYGLRNPFRADWDEEYGYFYIGEVGGNQDPSTDDVHLASLDQAGVFYGWNFYEGVNNFEPDGSVINFNPADFPQPDTDLADPANGDYFSAPFFDIPHSSLTGGFVYRGEMFPAEFDGVYFFGNYEDNYIRFLDLDSTGTSVVGGENGVFEFKPSPEIPDATTNIVYLEEGEDGALYYINYSANGGQVQRIVFEGELAPNIDLIAITDDQDDPNDGAGLDIPLKVTFAATFSDQDTPLSSLTYTLDFGDGTTVATGAPDPTTGAISVPHQYTAEGFYNASLSVSDGTNNTLSQPIAITVGDPNDEPVFLSVTAEPPFGDPGEEVTFTALVDDADADDPPESLTYVLDFGDGSPTVTGNPDVNGEIVVTHTYTDTSPTGPFNAFFTISDGEAPPVRSSNIPVQIGESSLLPVTEGLVFQVESFIKIGLNGTTVTEWLDESGNGNNLAALGDPQLVSNATQSGLPAIELDGTGDYLFRNDETNTTLSGFSSGNDPRTMFFVVDYEDVTNNEYAGLVYGNDAGNQAFGLTLDGNQDDLTVQGWGSANDRRTDVDGVIDPETNQQRGFVSHAVVFDGNNYSHYLNGEIIDSGSKTYNTVIEQLLIGQNLNGGETPLSVAAAFIYNRALDQSEFAAVEGYIQGTYLDGLFVNQPPDAINDAVTTDEGNILSGDVFADNGSGADSDPDDDTFSVTEVNGVAADVGAEITLTSGALLTLNNDGTFDYDPNGQFDGLNDGDTATDTFTYSIDDGNGGTDTATVTATIVGVTGPVNQPPDAINDDVTTDEDALLSGSVFADNASGADSDPDDDIFVVTDINGVEADVGNQISLASGALLTLNSDGSFDYDPNGQFDILNAGETALDSFTYSIDDGIGGTDTASVTVTINGVTDAPFDPTSDTSLVAYFESDINVIANQNGVVSEWLSGAGTNADLVASGNPLLVTNATPSGQAAISFDGDGDWLERTDPSPELPTGDAPRSIYFVVDYKQTSAFAGISYGTGTSNQAFGLVVNGNGGNLTVQGWGGGQDLISSENGIGNNDGSPGDDWFIHSVRYDGTTVRHYRDDTLIAEVPREDYATTFSRFVIGEEISGIGNGEELDVGAVLVYDEELNDTEHNQTVEYLTDKYLSTLPNTPPVAVDDTMSTDEDTSFTTANVLDNDTDADGDPLIVSGVDTTGTLGLVTDNGDGTFVYNPNGQFEGLNDGDTDTDSFNYSVSDGNGGTDTATVTVTISGVTDSGGGPSDNPLTSGLIAAFESDDGVVTSGSTVTSWNDSSDSTNNYDLTGVSGDPQVVEGGAPSGENAVAFDGNGDLLRIFGNDVDLSGLPSGNNARTLYFVVDYKTAGEFTGFGYGDNQAFESFGLITDSNELLAIDGWTNPANRVSTEEGVDTKGWMVQSVVLDGSDYQHYIHTLDSGLQLIDSGTDGLFNTDTGTDAALAIAGKVTGATAGEMDVAASLIYDTALSTGANGLGGDHATVSQYLVDKYIL